MLRTAYRRLNKLRAANSEYGMLIHAITRSFLSRLPETLFRVSRANYSTNQTADGRIIRRGAAAAAKAEAAEAAAR